MYKVQLYIEDRWVTLSWSNSFTVEWGIFERRRVRGEHVRFRANSDG